VNTTKPARLASQPRRPGAPATLQFELEAERTYALESSFKLVEGRTATTFFATTNIIEWPLALEADFPYTFFRLCTPPSSSP
jgi:hypothetical protein